MGRSRSHSSSGDGDFLQIVIHFALKMSTKSAIVTKKLVELVRRLTYGKRFFRCHVEFIFQYLKVKCSRKSLEGKGQQALAKVDTAIRMLQGMYDQKFEVGPQNFFYFSGFLSGI